MCYNQLKALYIYKKPPLSTHRSTLQHCLCLELGKRHGSMLAINLYPTFVVISYQLISNERVQEYTRQTSLKLEYWNDNGCKILLIALQITKKIANQPSCNQIFHVTEFSQTLSKLSTYKSTHLYNVMTYIYWQEETTLTSFLKELFPIHIDKTGNLVIISSRVICHFSVTSTWYTILGCTDKSQVHGFTNHLVSLTFCTHYVVGV